MSRASNYVTIDVDEIKAETDNAILVEYEGEDIWIPFSQIADPDEYKVGMENASISITK